MRLLWKRNELNDKCLEESVVTTVVHFSYGSRSAAIEVGLGCSCGWVGWCLCRWRKRNAGATQLASSRAEGLALPLETAGCREALVNYYMGLMNTIGAVVLSVFLIQSSVLASVRYLQTSMEAIAGQENVEIETEGYLLEKGVKETIMEYVDPVLKLLLLNQVTPPEDNAEAGAAGTSS